MTDDELIGLLGDVTGDAALIRASGLAAAWSYDLAIAAGPRADKIILSSRRRLLCHLGAGNADAAVRELEVHLRVLSFMERLSRGTRPKPTPPPAPGQEASSPRFIRKDRGTFATAVATAVATARCIR